MTTYAYKAHDQQGQIHKGNLNASDENAAYRQLQQRHLLPVVLKPKASGLSFLKLWEEKGFKEDVTLMTRQFSTLLITGIPITEALEALANEMEGKKIQMVLLDLHDRVAEGKNLYEAMSEFPTCFSPIYLGLIKVGEASGHMAEVLRELSQYLINQSQLRKKLSGALSYPIILVGIGSIVVGILVTTVIPTIANVLKEGGQTLPPSTQALMQLSSFLQAVLPWSLPLGIMGWMGLQHVLRPPQVRENLHGLYFKIPYLGTLIRKTHMARFSMTFSIMLRNGVPALEALEILEDTTTNLALKKAIQQIREGILSGEDLSTRIRHQSIFPPLMSFMMAMGEKSGRLDEVLTGVSEHYREEIDYEISKFTKAFEPIMIVSMAVVIGTIVYSVVSAILEMSNVR
jgi:type II secretory pathway component PulF